MAVLKSTTSAPVLTPFSIRDIEVQAQTLMLRRIAVGELELGDLPVGQWRELTAAEVELSLKPDTL